MRTLLPFLVFLAACGGGGGSGDSGPAALGIEMLIEPGVQTEVRNVVVRGTAVGAERVLVNGVPAKSDDGFRTWQVPINLVTGDNALMAEAIAPDGRTATQVRRVERRLSIDSDAWLVWNPATGRLIGTDVHRRTVRASDGQAAVEIARPWKAATGEDEFLSGGAVNTAGTVLYVFGQQSETIYAIDLATGNRTVVSSSDRGAGPAFAARHGRSLVLDEDDGRLLLFTQASKRTLYTVDIATGDRAVIPFSDEYINGFTFDPVGNILYIGHVVNNKSTLTSLDLDTGAEALVSGAATRGTGEEFFDREMLHFDAGRNVVVSLKTLNFQMIEIDLATGNRTTIPVTGLGDRETGAIDVAGGWIYVMDEANDGRNIRRVPITGGTAQDFWLNSRGTGRTLSNGRAMMFHAASGRLMIASIDRDAPGAFVVDLLTGDRTPLAEASDLELWKLAQDGDALYGSETRGVFKFDFAAETWDEVTGWERGTGPLLIGWNGLAVDETGGRAWSVSDDNPSELVQIDLATGDRTLFATGELGTVEELFYDGATETIFVLGGRGKEMYRVDPETGATSLISGEYGDGFTMTLHAGFLWTCGDGQLKRIDPATGAVTIVANEDDGGGMTLLGMRALAGNPATPEQIYGLNFNGSIIRIDLVTGERFLVSR